MNGQELKERRLKIGLTQLGLAHLLGVKENELYFWESGRRPIPKEIESTFEKIEVRLNKAQTDAE